MNEEDLRNFYKAIAIAIIDHLKITNAEELGNIFKRTIVAAVNLPKDEAQ